MHGEHTDRLLDSITVSLDDDDRELLDRPLDAEEVYLSMRSMSTNKSPGIDDLSLEFYRQFWALLADDLLVVYNDRRPAEGKAWSHPAHRSRPFDLQERGQKRA